jgi:anti-sigma factor RsiW
MTKSGDHLSCQDVVEVVTDYLDKALPPEEAALFEQHINSCEGCVFYVQQIKKTAEVLEEVREEHISPEAKHRLMRTFLDWRAS